MGIIASESWKAFEKVIWVAAKDTDIENRHLVKYLEIFTAVHPAFCQSPAAFPWKKKKKSELEKRSTQAFHNDKQNKWHQQLG